jgi:hypothetical protein
MYNGTNKPSKNVDSVESKKSKNSLEKKLNRSVSMGTPLAITVVAYNKPVRKM